jgi:hypothetical protein
VRDIGAHILEIVDACAMNTQNRRSGRGRKDGR